MNSQEKTMIDQLFQQLRGMENNSPPIDAEANRRIENHLRQHPTASYYMTQLLLLQKESLANAKRELEQLRSENPYEREPVQRDSWIGQEGQGFLAGAAQAALGIGGGLLLAEFIGDLLGSTLGDHGYYHEDGLTDLQQAQYADTSTEDDDSFSLFDSDWGDFI